MNILINASVVKGGGGLQVAHSFVNRLKKYPENKYIVVCSKQMYESLDINNFDDNFVFYLYQVSWRNFISNKFLHNIVKKHGVETVFTVFGPSYWHPKVPHVCGYAKPQYIYKNSPFFSLLGTKEKMKLYLKEKIQLFYFRRSTTLITENQDVSKKLSRLLPGKKIFTVTNYYHQIFETETLWQNDTDLGDFDGTTLTTISVNYPHKNLKIIPQVIRELKKDYPDFKFRFVVTLTPKQIEAEEEIKKHIVFLGNIRIEQCPYLYKQSDIMFLPTLLECFSASYPEAMYMEVPIVTSDLDFARGLCGDAAVYVDPLSPKNIASKIIELVNSPEKMESLRLNGKKQLLEFDNFEERVNKYLNIIYETNNTRP